MPPSEILFPLSSKISSCNPTSPTTIISYSLLNTHTHSDKKPPQSQSHDKKATQNTGRTTTRRSKTMTAPRSKSVDFSELLQYPCSHPRPSLPKVSGPIMEKTGENLESLVEHDGHEVNGERFGVVLGIISSSIPSPSASAKRFMLEGRLKLGSLSSSAEGKYSALKRVFSLRRSASVSERYCRIHDQSIEPTVYFGGEDCADEGMGSPQKPVKKQQHKGGKIIKACKRFFSLK